MTTLYLRSSIIDKYFSAQTDKELSLWILIKAFTNSNNSKADFEIPCPFAFYVS